MLRIFLILLFNLSFASFVFAQSTTKTVSNPVKSSPAYAEVLLRKTELESDVESLLISYTEDFPKIKESRFELNLIQKDIQTLLEQKDGNKLSLALGKLMIRRAEIATRLWSLQNQYGEDHPEVKRTKRKVLSFDNAIKEILP